MSYQLGMRLNTFPPAQSGPPKLPEDSDEFKFFRTAPSATPKRDKLPTTNDFGLVWHVSGRVFYRIVYERIRGRWEVNEEEEIELEERDLRVLLQDKGLI